MRPATYHRASNALRSMLKITERRNLVPIRLAALSSPLNSARPPAYVRPEPRVTEASSVVSSRRAALADMLHGPS